MESMEASELRVASASQVYETSKYLKFYAAGEALAAETRRAEFRMGYRSNREAEERLRAKADACGGYFTSREAADAGYGYSHLCYHVGTGRFERVFHGVYRLRSSPISQHDDLVRLSLWSRDRLDRPQAVVSHASALALHGLTLRLPEHVHLRVPLGFRKQPPAGCTLHLGAETLADAEAREGFHVTTPLRTLLDVATAPDVATDEVVRAARMALDRGLVSRSKLVTQLQRMRASASLMSRLRRAVAVAR